MRYFIDGYNFLFQLYEEVDPLRQKREEIIEILKEKLQELDLKISIIFDSQYSRLSDFPTRFESEGLEIIYTPSGQTADAYILENLAWAKTRMNSKVVTSDKHLASEAKRLGASITSIEEFVDWLVKKHLFQKRKERKQQIESSSEFHRLLEAFEKKLKEKFED